MNYVSHSLDKLSKEKKRITESRKAILEVFDSVDIALTANDILSRLTGRKLGTDLVTVYRNLDTLLELDLIHSTDKGFVKCSDFHCSNHEHCHHHFFCTKCEKYEELHLQDQPFISEIETKFPKLKITEHKFEFSGVCSNCIN